MKKWLQELGRYVLLTAITIFAIGVMIWVTERNDAVSRQARKQVTAPVPVVAQYRPLVAVEAIQPALHEVTLTASGKLQAWDTYSVGFESGGRVVELGVDENGNLLDIGSRVKKGQLLARLDDRILQARRDESAARLEQAASDRRRAQQIRRQDPGALTEADYQNYLTQHALAKAQAEIATKQLEDAVLRSPIAGTIAKQLVEPGESVTPHQTVFDVLENDRMVLMVEVPESQVGTLIQRMRSVQSRQESNDTSDPEAGIFRAWVTLEGRDYYGRQLPPLEGNVCLICEQADARTSLFKVAIHLANDDRMLRCGMVATAEIVIDRISAYRIPETAVLFRDEQAYVFCLSSQAEPLTVMFWEVDQIPLPVAEKIVLSEWIDQGDYLLVPTTSVKLQQLVVRGQQRLAPGQFVRLAGSASPTAPPYLAPSLMSSQASMVTRSVDTPRAE